MPYTPKTFTALSVLPASDLQDLADNDASFNDGTGIGNNAIKAAHLATNAITLGLASKTTVFSTSSTSPVLVTDLEASVTIPAGGRKVKITVYSPQVGSGNSGWTATISLWDGTVGSGTKITDAIIVGPTANIHVPVTMMAIVTPSAGSKTYRVGYQSSGPVVDFYGGSARPAFILVEAI